MRKAIFPIGHYVKDEVREIAEREHLVNARRKDSQGICFLGNIDYNEYVRRYLGEQPGDIIELETARRLVSTAACGSILSGSARDSAWVAARGLSSKKT